MAIKKQEFYEGAALHQLARTSGVKSISYEAPFFLLNNCLLAYLKYSTRVRTPWGFTFTAEEQAILHEWATKPRIAIAFICGSDGVAAVPYEAYSLIAAPRKSAIHISCYRLHGEHYQLNGPDGKLEGKVSPSKWRRILEPEADDDESL